MKILSRIFSVVFVFSFPYQLVVADDVTPKVENHVAKKSFRTEAPKVRERWADVRVAEENGLETLLLPTAEMSREDLKTVLASKDGTLRMSEDFLIPEVRRTLAIYLERMKKGEDANDSVEMRRNVLFLMNAATADAFKIQGIALGYGKEIEELRKKYADATRSLKYTIEAAQMVYKTDSVRDLFHPSNGVHRVGFAGDEVKKAEKALKDAEDTRNGRLYLSLKAELLTRSTQILSDMYATDHR